MHLLISESPSGAPAKVIQVLKQRVSRALRGKRRGAQEEFSLPFSSDLTDRQRLWQRTYYNFNVHSEKKLQEKLEYMHLNPVKQKLVRHPLEWPWSSWSLDQGETVLMAMDGWS